MFNSRVAVRVSILFVFSIVVLSQSGLAQQQRRKGKQKGKFLAETGSIDGAIWRFELKPNHQGPNAPMPIRGRYRVSDLKIYQADETGGEFTRQIGVCKPNIGSKNTVAEFETLRGNISPKQQAEPIKGKALLAVKSFGELEGEFVDDKGFKWTMNAFRVRE